MSITVPQGYYWPACIVASKRDSQKPDLTLVLSETPASAAGVYTRNLVCAAPVVLDRSRTPSDRIRTVVICSGWQMPARASGDCSTRRKWPV